MRVCCILLVVLCAKLANAGVIDSYWMYWADRHTVYRSHVDGSNKEILLTGTSDSRYRRIDVDPYDKKIYISGHSDNHSRRFVARTNLDGSNYEELIASGDLGIYTYGLGLDLVNDTIYLQSHTGAPWAPAPGGMQILNQDGTGLSWLPSSFRPYYSHDIEVDSTNSRLYYTDAVAYNGVRRANLNGTNIQNIINFGSGDSKSTHIALDVLNNEIYFSQYGGRYIGKANLDGSNRQTLISNIDAFDIEIDLRSDKLYWTTRTKIQRSNLDGSNIEDLVTLDIGGEWSADSLFIDNINVVPEPSTFLTLGGLMVLGLIGSRFRKKEKRDV